MTVQPDTTSVAVDAVDSSVAMPATDAEEKIWEAEAKWKVGIESKISWLFLFLHGGSINVKRKKAMKITMPNKTKVLDMFDVLQMNTKPSAVKKNMEAGHYNQKASNDSAKEANLTRGTGRVLNNPQLYNIFLGNWDSEEDKKRIKRLNQFTEDLLNHRWMSVLQQYGITTPGNFNGSIVIGNEDMELSDKEIQVILQTAIDSTSIAEPSANNVYMIYLSDKTSVNDSALNITMCNPSNDNAFGYHSFFETKKNGRFYYAVIPDLADDCVNSTCLGSLQCSLNWTQTREERQTQVASHEIAEIITNPESTSWYDRTTGLENADVCNGVSGKIKGRENAWNVQQMYSQEDARKTNGKTMCVSFSDAEYVGANQLINLSKYDVIGGIIGASLFLVLFHRKGVLGFVAYGGIGFLAGANLTKYGKKYIKEKDKVFLKLQINKLGEII